MLDLNLLHAIDSHLDVLDTAISSGTIHDHSVSIAVDIGRLMEQGNGQPFDASELARLKEIFAAMVKQLQDCDWASLRKQIDCLEYYSL